MDGNVLNMFGFSTVDACNSDENYAKMNNTTDINESDLTDSTQIYKQELCQTRVSKSASNKETTQQRHTDYPDAKFISSGHDTEKNTNNNWKTLTLHSKPLSKSKFSPRYSKRHNKSCLIFEEKLNYKSRNMNKELSKKTFTDENLEISSVTSKCTDKPEKIISRISYHNNLNTLCDQKIIKESKNETNLYAFKSKDYYDRQTASKKSKCESSTFDRQKHHIPSVDYFNYRKMRKNIDIFNTAFTSEYDYEHDLSDEEFYEKQLDDEVQKILNTLTSQRIDASIADVPTDDLHIKPSSHSSNKRFLSNFRFSKIPWISQKLEEINRKLFKNTQNRESLNAYKLSE